MILQTLSPIFVPANRQLPALPLRPKNLPYCASTLGRLGSRLPALAADAAADFLQARLHSLLNDFHRFAGRLRRQLGRVSGSLDGNIEDFFYELRLLGEDFLRVSHWLVAPGQSRGFAQTRFENLPLLLRHGLRAPGGDLRRFAERLQVLRFVENFSTSTCGRPKLVPNFRSMSIYD